jgi:multimeric flavodoxin WrbA
MSKKVIIISASPRRGGNSDTLCNEFIRGAQEAGNETEKVFLRDTKIGYCTGCGVCNSTHQCIQRDDMAAILNKMVTADVIVLATPVYFYAMDGQMKTLIDRTVPRYTEISDKDFYFIVAAADTDKNMLERTIEGFRGFTDDCLTNAHEKGIIYGTGAWQIDDIKNSSAMRQAYVMGKQV